MSRVTGALKATYNFFAGDAIILVGVVLAFVVCALLLDAAKAPNALAAAIFVALIAGSLALTLGRELAGRPRQR